MAEEFFAYNTPGASAGTRIDNRCVHSDGDDAINGIAAVLKEHFRSDDILVRAGGDEFLVFLLEAAQSAEAVGVSMTALLQKLSREGLLKGYEQGHENIHTYFRFFSGETYSWVECMTIFYVNENGDVCEFTMLRWADDRTSSIERLRLRKILELSAASDFEYICLVDVKSKIYTTFSRDRANSHRAPETGDFEEISRYICENHIAEESRQLYMEHASLERLQEFMKQAGGDSHSYRYTMTDGITREATVSWYEDSHFELLLTVKRLG